MISSTVMMAEAVAVRPSPDMSATCSVRLYMATTWGDGNMGSGDRVGTRPGLAGCCRAGSRARSRPPASSAHIGEPCGQQNPLLQAPSESKHPACSQALGQNVLPGLSGSTAPLSTSDSAPVQEGARDPLPSQINMYEAPTACRALRGTDELGPCAGARQGERDRWRPPNTASDQTQPTGGCGETKESFPEVPVLHGSPAVRGSSCSVTPKHEWRLWAAGPER